MRLHGAIREFGMARDERLGRAASGRRPTSSRSTASRCGRGSRVRLRPRAGARRLRPRAGRARSASCEAIEEDMEGDVHLAVDGRGRPRARPRRAPRSPATGSSSRPTRSSRCRRAAGRGRASSSPASATCSSATTASASRSRRGSRAASCPPGVDVVDFGIRGMDLAYALGDGYDAALLLDAAPRGEPPGTLSLIEPELDDGEAGDRRARDGPRQGARARARARARRRRGRSCSAASRRPRMSGDEDELVAELSEPVRAALDEAVRARRVAAATS